MTGPDHEQKHAASHAAFHGPRVWLGLLVPPTAWFIALNACYFMVAWACDHTAGRVWLHLVCLAMLAATVAAGFGARGLWRDLGRRWPAPTADPLDRARFLAAVGGFAAALFSFAIVLQWLATLILDPCEPSPRFPLFPEAWLGGDGGGVA